MRLSFQQLPAGLSCLYRKRIDGLGWHRHRLLQSPIRRKIAISGKQGKDPSAEAQRVSLCCSLFQDRIADEHFPLRGLDGTGSDAAELNLLPHVSHPGQSLMISEPDYLFLIIVRRIHISVPVASAFIAQKILLIMQFQAGLKRSCHQRIGHSIGKAQLRQSAAA